MDWKTRRAGRQPLGQIRRWGGVSACWLRLLAKVRAGSL